MTDANAHHSPSPDATGEPAATDATELDAQALEAVSGGLTVSPIIGKPTPIPLPGPCPGPTFPDLPLPYV